MKKLWKKLKAIPMKSFEDLAHVLFVVAFAVWVIIMFWELAHDRWSYWYLVAVAIGFPFFSVLLYVPGWIQARKLKPRKNKTAK